MLNDNCENCKSDIGIWYELNELPKEKRVLAIHLSLNYRTRGASSEVNVTNLKKEIGLDILLTKLNLFLLNNSSKQFTAFQSAIYIVSAVSIISCW